MNEIIVLTREQLQDVIREAVVAASQELIKQTNSQKHEVTQKREIMTLEQVAKRLLVTKQSILNWARRGEKDNPLPVRYAGSNPRFWWSEINEWTIREAARRIDKKSA